jgi:molybdate transport system substrate-binding protein
MENPDRYGRACRSLPGLFVISVIATLGGYWFGSQKTASVSSVPEKAEETQVTDAVTHATPPPYDAGVFATIKADRSILLHCGNSMRPAAEPIAAEFQRRTGIAVQMNFGGSAELLSTIELSGTGDLYLCHDPYAAMLENKKLLAKQEVVGYLAPIVIVPSGNPKRIASVRDILASGVRVAVPDARYSTAGRLVREALRAQGVEELLNANLVMEGRGHNDVAMAVLSAQADAGIVWRFIAYFYRGRLERVDTGLEIPPTRVTLCVLTTARDSDAVNAFLDLAVSEFGRSVFGYQGYYAEIWKTDGASGK